jgi:hypothetical protein
MGAYLSEPVLEKHSSDENGEFLSFGASSMQGWRVSQEVWIFSVVSQPSAIFNDFLFMIGIF